MKIVVPALRTYYMCAETNQECLEWISILSKARIAAKSTKGATSPPSPSASTPSAAPAKPRINMDSFDIIKVLGRGTFGKVQLVRSKIDGKLYAMKTIVKQLLVEAEAVEQTIIEKKVLLQTSHPFLVSAYAAFQTPQKIYLIIDYVPGGELFGRLRADRKFNESRARLYAAEIALGLGALHKAGIIYRDIKPENVLLDAEGHVKLTDFGFVKTQMHSASSTTNTFCGTPEYMAPEVVQERPYTRSVDWWSFGCLVYEMLVGHVPFYDQNTNKLFRMIMHDDVNFPLMTPIHAKDLITQLMDRNPQTRLGSGDKDVEEVMAHPFFAPLKSDDVLAKKIPPEWTPDIRSADDTHLFDEEYTAERPIDSYAEAPVIDPGTQQHFLDFTCVQDSEI
jgi:serine/threonine protein kinase